MGSSAQWRAYNLKIGNAIRLFELLVIMFFFIGLFASNKVESFFEDEGKGRKLQVKHPHTICLDYFRMVALFFMYTFFFIICPLKEHYQLCAVY